MSIIVNLIFQYFLHKKGFTVQGLVMVRRPTSVFFSLASVSSVSSETYKGYTVEPRSTDTRLIRTPVLYGQFRF